MASKQQSVDFRLTKVELYKVELTPPSSQLAKDTIFEFDINSGYQFYADEKEVVAHTDITIKAQGGEGKLGKIGTAVVFTIENWNQVVKIVEGEVNVPSEFMTILHSIAYSTTRGIMYMQFRGTFLQNAHLPVIDPKNLNRPNRQS